MRLVLILLVAALAACAADAWTKVRDLKGGAELRIYKINARQPLLATFDELTDENLVVVIKDQQTAIARDQIERIDARPPQKGSRVVRESKSSQTVNDGRDGSAGRPGSHAGTSTNVSSGLSIGSKPDFETVFRRTAVPPQR